MATGLNLNNLNVDSSGRASFSGLASGIDFQKTVDDIIAAKRIPAVTLENRITDNDAKISALGDFRALLDTLKNRVSALRGAVTFDGSGDVFKGKQVFATTSRSDGKVASTAANLVGISVTNAATVGSHELEVRRVGTAHKITTNAFTSTTAALGLSGSFTVSDGTNDATITVAATDGLTEIRDRINNADTGTNPTGIAASIISVSPTQNFLVITRDDPGAQLIVNDSGSVLSGLGVSTTNGLGGYRNGLTGTSKVETADGFKYVQFDGTRPDTPFLVSYDSATRVLTLTDGTGATDTATLTSDAIAAGATETASFADFGATLVLDSTFDKTTDITVAADAASVTGGTGAIDPNTIKIAGATGNVSGLTTSTLTFGNLAAPTAISVTAGGFSGTFDGSTSGAKTVTLSDGSGNSVQVDFTLTAAFNGSETAASVTLNELQNLIAATGTPFSNVLQKAQSARLTVDGLKDATHFESAVLTSATAALTGFAPAATFPGSFDIVGTGTATINYDATDTLTTLKDKINLAQGTTGVTAKVVADGTGFRLNLDSANAFSLTDTSGLAADLSINDDLVIERQTNTITDVVPGMTISLFQAEPGTAIKVDVENDLTTIKTAIQDFVTAYNDARVFINTQNQVDPTTGAKGDNSGVLFGNSVMNGLRDQLSDIIGLGTTGVSGAFSVLAQIGVNFVDNATLTDALQNDTLVVDETKLDATLISNIDDVRRLFTFDFSASDSNVSLLDRTGNTTFSASGYTLNIGTIGNFDQLTKTVTDKVATLDQATSAGATVTGSQSFKVNGTAVTYDIQVDNLQTLAQKINDAAIAGVTATVVDDTSGSHIAVNSATNPLTIDTDTGDVVSKLQFAPDANIIDSADINGVAGSVTISGRVLTATNATGADGLKLFYNGAGGVSGITLNFTTGAASQSFFALDGALDLTDGSIQGEVASLQGQNKLAQDRIDNIDLRLELQRQSLLDRFVAAEAALSQMNTLLTSIQQTFGVLTQSKN